MMASRELCSVSGFFLDLKPTKLKMRDLTLDQFKNLTNKLHPKVQKVLILIILQLLIL